MAEDNKEETKEDAAGSSAKKKKKISKKLLILFILLPLLLAAGVGGGLYVSGIIGATHEEEAKPEHEQQASESAFFFEMPEMLINLSTNGKKPSYLKLRLSLALESAEDQSHIEAVLPLIVDQYQVYLRGLHVDDLQGAAGLQRLKEELLLRAELVAKPIKVRDVLFSQMLVQ